jgi:hypothetical protein
MIDVNHGVVSLRRPTMHCVEMDAFSATSRLLKNSLLVGDRDVSPRIKHCKCLIRHSRVWTSAAPGALKKARKAFFNIQLGKTKMGKQR